MKTARRMPRKVGGGEDEDPQDTGRKSQAPPQLPHIDLIEPQQPADVQVEPVTFVKRPTFKPKKPSNLRASFAPADDEAQDDTETPSLAVKRPLKHNAILRPPQDRESSAELPLRVSADRPSYSASHLAELKSSTPATPSSNRSSIAPEPNQTSNDTTLDIASKFGSSALALSHDPLATSTQHIPTETEIREKKERRRRLAQEENADAADYIALDSGPSTFSNARSFDRRHDSDDDEDADHRTSRHSNNLIIPADDFTHPSKPETRLERDDEDIAEGFDAFVEDEGKVTLKGRAAREQEKQRRKGIAEQIRAAQFGYGYNAGGDSGSDEDGNDRDRDGEEDVDPEEVSRNEAYEAKQTRAGIYGVGYASGSNSRVKDRDREEAERKRLDMPKVKPVPEFKVVVARFADLVKGKEEAVTEKRRLLERVRREQSEIAKEEERVKMLLREAGERFEKLRSDAVGAGAGAGVEGATPSANGAAMETYKSVAPGDSEHVSVPAEDSSEDERPAFAGLGSLSGRMAGSGPSGMAAMPMDDDEDDYY